MDGCIDLGLLLQPDVHHRYKSVSLKWDLIEFSKWSSKEQPIHYTNINACISVSGPESLSACWYSSVCEQKCVDSITFGEDVEHYPDIFFCITAW